MFVKINYIKAKIILESLYYYSYDFYAYDELGNEYNRDDIKDLIEEFKKICDTLYKCK